MTAAERDIEAEKPTNGIDQLIAEVFPNLSPATVRSALGWPAAINGHHEHGETGWPR